MQFDELSPEAQARALLECEDFNLYKCHDEGYDLNGPEADYLFSPEGLRETARDTDWNPDGSHPY